MDVGTHACSLAGAIRALLLAAPMTAAIGLGFVGIGYGNVSGLAAAAIAQYWHKNRFGHTASRLYIAGCAAAITLPVVAGAVFDRPASDAGTMWAAAAINVPDIVAARGLPAAN